MGVKSKKKMPNKINQLKQLLKENFGEKSYLTLIINQLIIS